MHPWPCAVWGVAGTEGVTWDP